jgi:hypothetical protein
VHINATVDVGARGYRACQFNETVVRVDFVDAQPTRIGTDIKYAAVCLVDNDLTRRTCDFHRWASHRVDQCANLPCAFGRGQIKSKKRTQLSSSTNIRQQTLSFSVGLLNRHLPFARIGQEVADGRYASGKRHDNNRQTNAMEVAEGWLHENVASVRVRGSGARKNAMRSLCYTSQEKGVASSEQ